MKHDPMRTESWLIIGYNLLLLGQVFVLGIPAGNILLIFGFENILLGVVALFSLLRARRGGDIDYPQFLWDQKSGVNLARWPVMWVFGYGMFTAVAMLLSLPFAVGMGIELTPMALGIPILFAIGREVASAVQLAWLPTDQQLLADRRIVADAKTRMIVLHMVVVLGGVLVMFTGLRLRDQLAEVVDDPEKIVLKLPLMLLVIFKTIGEIVSVRRARRITAGPQSRTGPASTHRPGTLGGPG